MAREIPLGNGRVALVDDADYERVAAHRWHEGRKMVVDSIAYHEALQENDERRGRLAGLRERLAAGDAAKPVELAAVDYKVPSVPSLSVEEATKRREQCKY